MDYSEPSCNPEREAAMSVAKVIEVIASSKKSFEDAIQQGIVRSADSLTDVSGVWIKDQKVVVAKGKIIEYRVLMKLTFVLKEAAPKRK